MFKYAPICSFQQKIFRILFIGLVLIAVLTACDKTEIQEITEWEQLSDFPGTPRASATSFVVGDKAYICLGRSAWNDGHLKDFWEYNSKTDTWTRKSDFPGKARVKAVGASIGSKAYIGMGGAYTDFEVTNSFSDFWEYDTETDVWTEKAPFPGSAKNDIFCTAVNGKIYTVLGFDGTMRHRETWEYDPLVNTWMKKADFPESFSNSTGFSIGDDLFVGTGLRGSNYKWFYRYDLYSDIWERVCDLPKARMLSNGMSIGEKGYVLLGRFWNGTLNGGKLLSDIVEYDPALNIWTERGDFPGGARQNSVVFSIEGRGYIVMGEDDKERKSDVWSFKP